MDEVHARADGTEPLLRLAGITKRFTGVLALDGVDLDVRAGELHVLFGENGAGKSTLINVISRTFAPDAGSFRFGGQEIGRLSRIGRARSASARCSRNSPWCRA